MAKRMRNRFSPVRVLFMGQVYIFRRGEDLDDWGRECGRDKCVHDPVDYGATVLHRGNTIRIVNSPEDAYALIR